MFKDNTVFVVGAGASAEFNMPVGYKLMEMIAQNSLFKFEFGNLKEGVTQIYHHLTKNLNMSKQEDVDWINLRLQTMRKVSDGIDLSESIDEYIFRYSSDPIIAEVGKLQIAYSIAYSEQESLLRTDRFNSKEGFKLADGTWIHTFAKALFNGVKVDQIGEIGSNISIVCFNYDRCIEHYLEIAMMRAYSGLTQETAREIVGKINIIHPYGTLGHLQHFPYGKIGNLQAMADNIQTWSETVRDPDTVSSMKRAIADAEHIVFLGFAFAKQNMDLLDARVGIRDERIVRTYSTGFGLHKVGEEDYKEKISVLYKGEPLVSAMNAVRIQWDTKCAPFMEMYRYNLVQ
ncbi:hypothetical protein [Rhizobium leguminosarum]|uniref:hypothetical protein n=1 Tax=Rhizobium leguminosarum TaxID=384 RepID=UPI003F9C5969